MTPDRPDETLAPLPDHDFDDDGICRVCQMDACDHSSNISGCRSWADADALRAELTEERRLSAEKDAQLEYAASFAKQMERVWNEATAELAAIEKALEGNPRDGLLLIDRITALVVQRNADDERCKWWAKNDADLNQRITLADNEVVRLHLALAEKDAKLARAERDVELLTKARESYDADRRAAVQEMGGWRERATLAERELAEQSATLARLEQELGGWKWNANHGNECIARLAEESRAKTRLVEQQAQEIATLKAQVETLTAALATRPSVP